MRNKPINTSAQPGELHLASAMIEGSSRAILNQEARGQRELAESTASLPSRILHSTEEDFRKMGIEFGDVYEDDPIFRRVKLPDGWKIVPTAHSMWSHLVDAKGRKRAEIFYKAAFYDRSTHMWATQRYVTTNNEAIADIHVTQYVVYDNDEKTIMREGRVFTQAAHDSQAERSAFYANVEADESLLRAWLDEHFPNHKDPNAYRD